MQCNAKQLVEKCSRTNFTSLEQNENTNIESKYEVDIGPKGIFDELYDSILNEVKTDIDSSPIKYKTTEEEDLLLSFADGPTPVQIYNSILTKKLPDPPICLKEDDEENIKINIILKEFKNVFQHLLSKLCDKELEKHKEEAMKKEKEKYEVFKNKFSKENLEESAEKYLKKLEEDYYVLRERRINDFLRNKFIVNLNATDYYKEKEKYLDILNSYKKKFVRDQAEIYRVQKLDEMRKNGYKMIKKFNDMTNQNLQNYADIMYITTRPTFRCGYKGFLNHQVWLRTTFAAKEKELNILNEDLENDKLELTSLKMVIQENLTKYEGFSQVLCDLLDEYQMIIAHIVREVPYLSDYLPIFEEFFKKRMTLIIQKNKEEVLLPDDPKEQKTMENMLSQAEIDIETPAESIKEDIVQPRHPLAITFPDVHTFAKNVIEPYHYTEEEFNAFIEDVVEDMKKIPNIWRHYVGYI